MSKKKIIAVAFFLLSSVFGHSNYSAAEDDEIPEWGFYVYMAGDNTLDNELTDDLNEMKMVGSNENLEIVALTDKLGENNSHVYHVLKHNLNEYNLSEVNTTWQNELDMGEGDTLRDFLIWASSEFPAKRKILIIWNHGSGWEKVAEDGSSFLTVPEINSSLTEYRETTNQEPFTLIGFDACLMGMFEIMYELKEHSEMIHGSEAYEPLEGWTYNNLLYKLGKDLDNQKLAYNVVNDYVESYRNGSVYTSYSVTASVVSSNNMEKLWNELNNFSFEINSILPVFKEEVANARSETQRFDQNPNYRDLYDLSVRIEKEIPLLSVKKASQDLREVINQTVIFEDHWEKPGKLKVEKANGMTIYFPTDGVKKGYDKLQIYENKWFEFISNYENQIEPESNFTFVSSKSVDTGTGYNDSVLVNGSYEGKSNILVLKMINAQGQVIESIIEELDNNSFDNLIIQPKKSGNYSIELTLYNDSGYLQDYYYKDKMFVDLNLPDLHLETPQLFSETSRDIFSHVKAVDINDNFFVEGKIKNLGTVNANNVSLKIKYEGREKIINHSKLSPDEFIRWNLTASEILHFNESSRNIVINLSVSSSDFYEIDPENNVTSFSFLVHENIPHYYNSNVKNMNTITLESDEHGYYFSWLKTEISIIDTVEQSWDIVNFKFDLPDSWGIKNAEILHIDTEGKAVIEFRPPIDIQKGETKIPFEIINGNGIISGYGNVSITIPQYYGVDIAAQQIDSNIKILVTNTGNGKDTFKLTKELDKGLTLYLTETYFELEPSEIKEISSQGLETETTSDYSAYFRVESVGNNNISANVVLEIKGTVASDSGDNLELNAISITAIGIVILSVFVIIKKRT